jgi:hypothetical protein
MEPSFNTKVDAYNFWDREFKSILRCSFFLSYLDIVVIVFQ